ncbi:peptidylprolyl isomerase [Bradyrhizobium sp. DASA03120]|uniref:peptidylprolyl isomerase n=1 Tax=Bradyrhizobium sp. SMVTL-02 TaxID=3395917 RepID=UPI003F6FC1A5
MAKEFGPGFAVAAAKLPAGSWQGPVESGFGWHLLFVDTVTSGRLPAFEEVEAEVKTAWLAEQKVQAWQKAYEEMRSKYEVLLPAERVPGNDSPSNGETSQRTAPPVSSSRRSS